MIKSFLTIALGLSVIWAQSTFSYVPYSVGARVDYKLAANNLPAGSAGTGVTWDFSAWTPFFDFSQEVIAVSGSPYAGDFPTANACLKSSFGVMGTLYTYGIQTSTEFTRLGQRDMDPIDYTTPKIDISYPLSFGGSSAVFPYQEVGQPAGSTQYTYDGFGTLITPAGTYTSIMRIRQIDNDGTTNDTMYFFFASGSLFPVAAIDQDSSNGYWSVSTPTALDPGMEYAAHIFPSPANTYAHIFCGQPGTSGSLSLNDLNGRMVRQVSIDAGQGLVDVQGLPAGTYLLSGVLDGKIVAQRLFVE